MKIEISDEVYSDISKLTEIRDNAEQLADSADREYWQGLEQRWRQAATSFESSP